MAELNVPSGPPTTTTTTTAAATTQSKDPPPGTSLVAIDLENSSERDILAAQRIVCGWGQDSIPMWREAVARGDRTMFWITLSGESLERYNSTITSASERDKQCLQLLRRKSDENTTKSSDQSAHLLLPVGHVSLDKADTPNHGEPDPSSTAADGSVLLISSLFVMPQFKSMRLGAFAMDGCEYHAQRLPYGSPNCRAVCLNTLSTRYHKGGLEGPEGMGMWERIGVKMPAVNHGGWYKRRGYVPYKEEVRYYEKALSGEQIGLYAVFMRKELPDLTS